LADSRNSLAWSELSDGVGSADLAAQTVPERLKSRKDPWADSSSVDQTIRARPAAALEAATEPHDLPGCVAPRRPAARAAAHPLPALVYLMCLG
jgi:hypothetical protein